MKNRWQHLLLREGGWVLKLARIESKLLFSNSQQKISLYPINLSMIQSCAMRISHQNNQF